MKTIGIDLGTTNTSVASNQEVLLIKDVSGSSTQLPSVVSFVPTGSILLGKRARRRRAIDPQNTIVSSKRLMGETFRSACTRRYQQQYANELLKTEGGGVAFQTRRGVYTAQQLGSLIIARMCECSDVDPAENRAVVAVPVAFDSIKRTAIALAVKNVGFGDVMTIEEPVATAIAYVNASSQRYAAVYDFGGGTFDLAIIDCSSIPFRVLARGGDDYLGGDDIDKGLGDHVARHVLNKHGWDLCNETTVYVQLLFEAELAKIRLSRFRRTTINPQLIDPAIPAGIESLTIDRDILIKSMTDLIRRTFVICDEVVAQAGLKPNQIQSVFLAGGSTKIPGLAQQVGAYFGCHPRSDIDPIHVVCFGASMAAVRPALLGL